MHKKRKRKLSAAFAFPCTGAAGDKSKAQLHTVLESQSSDLLRQKLDYASAAPTSSTATGANFLSTLKEISDHDRAALLRMISEQYSIPSDASTPQEIICE